MDFYELIRTRESVRGYDVNRPVDEAVLKRILEAGRVAPSAANRQPWRLVVVSSPQMLEKVRPCYPRPWLKEAPHILVVIGRRKEAWVRQSDGYNSIETDLAIVMDHLILAATAEGLATCWIAAFEPAILYQALSFKDDEVVFAITPLGYPKPGHKPTPKQRKTLEDIAQII